MRYVLVVFVIKLSGFRSTVYSQLHFVSLGGVHGYLYELAKYPSDGQVSLPIYVTMPPFYSPLPLHTQFLSDFFLPGSEGLDQAEGASTGFMFASGGRLHEGYGHGGSGVSLVDGPASAWAMSIEGVPSRVGRGDALLRRLDPHLT